jgi:hypothetical protein
MLMKTSPGKETGGVSSINIIIIKTESNHLSNTLSVQIKQYVHKRMFF